MCFLRVENTVILNQIYAAQLYVYKDKICFKNVEPHMFKVNCEFMNEIKL